MEANREVGAPLVDQIEGRRIQHGQPKTVGDALDFRKDYRPEEGKPFKFAYDIDATQYPVITEDLKNTFLSSCCQCQNGI